MKYITQPRRSNGKWKKELSYKTRFTLISLLIGSIMFSVIYIPDAIISLDETIHWIDESNARPVVSPLMPKAEASETLEARVDELMDDLVVRLAQDCESRGAKEPDALLIFDTNREASIGALQFQIKTVQHYAKVFEDRDITRKEAIEIAMDWDKASALAKQIIFYEEGGLWNWTNCAKKLELAGEVVILRKLADIKV